MWLSATARPIFMTFSACAGMAKAASNPMNIAFCAMRSKFLCFILPPWFDEWPGPGYQSCPEGNRFGTTPALGHCISCHSKLAFAAIQNQIGSQHVGRGIRCQEQGSLSQFLRFTHPSDRNALCHFTQCFFGLAPGTAIGLEDSALGRTRSQAQDSDSPVQEIGGEVL